MATTTAIMKPDGTVERIVTTTSDRSQGPEPGDRIMTEGGDAPPDWKDDARRAADHDFVRRPTTVDEAGGTMEVVATTSDPVYRWGFYEVLSLESGAADLGRAKPGRNMPFLKDHSNSVDDVIGRVEKVWIEKDGDRKILVAKVKLAEAQYMGKIMDGVLGNISIGYSVKKWKRDAVGEGEAPTYRATKWELQEISMVAVQADKDSQVRSQDPKKVEKKSCPDGSGPMQSKQEVTKMPKDAPPTDPDHRTPADPAPPPPTRDAPQPDPAPKADAQEKARREDVATITEICMKHGMGSKAAVFLRAGLSVDEVRSKILEAIEAKDAKDKILADAGPGPAEAGTSGLERKNEDIGKYFAFRATENRQDDMGKDKFDDSDSEFKKEMSFVDVLKRYFDDPWAAPNRLIKRGVSTGDLPGIFTDVMNKELRRGYREQPDLFGPIVRRRSVGVLQNLKVNRFDASLVPEDMGEGEEYTYATVVDGQDEIAIKKRGKAISLTLESMLKDDLGALETLIEKFGRGVRLKENTEIVNLLFGGTATVEGKTLFHADHNNSATLASGTKVISNESIDTARTAMATQKSPAGDLISLEPRYVIAAEALRSQAASYLRATHVPTLWENQTRVYTEGIRGIIHHGKVDEVLGGTNKTKRIIVCGDKTQADLIIKGTVNRMDTPELTMKWDEARLAMIYFNMYFSGYGLADYRNFYQLTEA